jgi:hypothetical protein
MIRNDLKYLKFAMPKFALIWATAEGISDELNQSNSPGTGRPKHFLDQREKTHGLFIQRLSFPIA